MIKLDLNPPPAQLYQFGSFALAGFPLVAVALTFVAGLPTTAANILLALGALIGLAGAFEIRIIVLPVYVLMMLLAWPIGMVISTTLLGLIYYGLFTPVGLFFKMTGRDLLHRKLDRSAKSYWTVRETQRTPASYMRLY